MTALTRSICRSGPKKYHLISKTSFSRAKSSSASVIAKPARSSVSSAASHSRAAQRKPWSKSVPLEGLSSLPSTSSSERCASCGQAGVQLRKVTRSFGHGPTLLVIESIPMLSCPQRSESYFTAQTLPEIGRIKTLRKSVAVTRHVPVAVFTSNVPNKTLHRTRPKAARR
jgi:YgiT-type zinc finger domain-containing protein